MSKKLRISVSSLKKYNASKATWAWYYILWIKDTFESDALVLGNLFEDWLLTWEENFDKHFESKHIYDLEWLMKDYDALKHNAQGLEFEKWKFQYKIEGEVFNLPFLWYADNYTDEWIDDIKTSRYLTKKDTKQVNSRSGLTYYQEYELQLWLYMKILWRKKARIIEIAKHRYKDGRNAHQIIEFIWSNERDKDMTDKWWKKVEEMKLLWAKHI